MVDFSARLSFFNPVARFIGYFCPLKKLNGSEEYFSASEEYLRRCGPKLKTKA